MPVARVPQPLLLKTLLLKAQVLKTLFFGALLLKVLLLEAPLLKALLRGELGSCVFLRERR